MRTAKTFIRRLLHLFGREQFDRELQDELASHMQLQVEDNLRGGMSADEARRAAVFKLGGLEQTKESLRDLHVLPWLDALRRDATFGYRQLAKNKITSLAAILSLALAIGACTSSFRLIDAILLRPLPVSHPERLYSLSRLGIGWDGKPEDFDGWAYPDFQLMRDAAKDQADLLAISYSEYAELTFKSDQETEKAQLQYVSGNMFSVFGLQPALGRLLNEDDDTTLGARPVAVISYDYWTRRFTNDPSVLSKRFRIGNRFWQIVGVGPKQFIGTEPANMIDIFVPSMMNADAIRKDSTWHRTFALLKPGATIGPLRAKLDAISRAFEAERAKSFTNMSQQAIDTYLNHTVQFASATSGSSGFQQDNRRSLAALGVLAFLVLLIACANVTNLMVAQAAARAREMALRISIGAGRRHLLQLVLVESAILALISSAIGAIFAWWSAPFVVSMINPSEHPVRLPLPVDWRVFAFGLCLSLVVACLFGLLPALRASAVHPVSALKGSEDPHSRGRLMYALIAVQVAFCFLVLFVAGLLAATFQRLSNQPLGFSADRLLVLDTIAQNPVDPAYWGQVADHLRRVPGIERVSISNRALLDGYATNNSISVNGAPPSEILGFFLHVSPGWFDTMKIPLLDGRDFLPNETSPGAAIVNETFVRAFFHDENPIGKSFDEVSDEGPRSHYQVVGLVHDTRYRAVREDILPTAYVPFHSIDAATAVSTPLKHATFVVRTANTDSLASAPSLRAEVSQAGPEFRVSRTRTQLELVQMQTVRERILATLASFFSAVALLLAGVGLYGVLHYSILQRRHEIAIRMAVGAQVPAIVHLVVLPIFTTILAGGAFGLTAGLLSVRYLEELFYQVKATDLSMLVFPALAILIAALLAALPAVIHALRTDPATILRTE
jgi:predicted permease